MPSRSADHPRPADHPGHADHDGLLISAFVAGDLDERERARAEGLLAACSDCRRLAADLRSISAVLPFAAAPRRTRDFRLTEGQMSGRTDVRSAFDRLRARLRPAGAALTTIGIAGLLLAGVSGLTGNAASSPTILSNVGNPVGQPAFGNDYGKDAAGAGGGVASPAESAASVPGSPGAFVPETGSTPGPVASAAAGGETRDAAGPTPSGAPAPPGPSPLLVGSIALLGIGLVLLAGSVVLRPRS